MASWEGADSVLSRLPGAGKTILAAITIDHLLRAEQSNTIGVVYILCNYKAHADRNTISLLAAILKQLVQARPSIAEPIVCMTTIPTEG